MSDGPLDVAAYKGLLLTRELGRDVRYLRQVGSTNDLALTLADEGAAHGLVVLAEEQTAGKGRQGRSWSAPAGEALLFSVILRPQLQAPDLPRLTLAAAVAVAAVLRDGGLERCQIKWPNDVLLGKGKVAGVLCESRTGAAREPAVVMGVGVNVNQEAEGLVPGATSIRVETGVAADRAELLAALLTRLEREYALTVSGRFEDVRQAWLELSPLARGHRVRVEDGPGAIEGLADGLDEDGALLVRTSGGERRRVTAGTARFQET